MISKIAIEIYDINPQIFLVDGELTCEFEKLRNTIKTLPEVAGVVYISISIKLSCLFINTYCYYSNNLNKRKEMIAVKNVIKQAVNNFIENRKSLCILK